MTTPRSRTRPFAIVGLGLLFGTLWGAAQALWILVPILVDDHRIWPRTSLEWLTLLAALTAVCVAIAAVTSLLRRR